MLKMMTTSQPPRDTANLDPATIRALSSITSQQAETIARAVRAAEPAWEVQFIDDYDGYLSILIAPSVSDDEQKSFFISGSAQRLELFEAIDDSMSLVESFSDVEDLSAQLLSIMAQQ